MTLKRLVAVMAAMLICITLCGCSLATLNTQRYNKQVVAVVNGEEITMDELIEGYDYYSSAYGLDTSTLSTMEIKSYKTMVLNALAQTRVYLQKAKEMGIELSDADMAEVEEQYQQAIDSGISYYASKYNAKLETDPDFDVNAAAYQDVVEQLAEKGQTLDDVRQGYLDSMLITKLQEYLGKDIAIDDEEVQQEYDALQNIQKIVYDDIEVSSEELTEAYEKANLSSATAFTFEEDLESENIIVYYPSAKNVKVKHILIKISEEYENQLYEIMASDLSEEEQKTQSDEISGKALAEIYDKANEVLEMAKSGQDFDALINEYGEDPGMLQYMETGGYLVYEGSPFEENFLNAALQLEEVGDISELVDTPYGYHILTLAHKYTTGAVDIEAVSEQLAERIRDRKAQELWSQETAKWMEQADIVIHDSKF